MSKAFVWWSLIAVAMTYIGIIVGGYSNRRIWKVMSKVGQIIGAVGLFTILLYLAVE